MSFLQDWILQGLDITVIEEAMNQTMYEWENIHKSNMTYEYLEYKRNHPAPRMLELPEPEITITGLPNELIQLPQIIHVLSLEHYGDREINILKQLYEIQQSCPANSQAMKININKLLPALDITKNYYDDLELGLKGINADLVSNLDALAYNTGNHMIQRFVANYQVACYVFTCKKHNLDIRKETMKRIYESVMRNYKNEERYS